MSGISYSTLVTQIRGYTEVDSNVLTTDVLENIILNAQQRIFLDVPMDSDRFVQEGTLSAGNNSINAPAGALFIRGIQVYDSTSAISGPNTWLEKKDVTYLQEYVSSTASTKRGKPKYYSMYGGATTGATTATSGAIYVAPTPNANYQYIIHYNVMPTGLGSGADGNSNTYVSNYFPQGLLYACLVEAFMFLKGPTDMLTLYENKYKTSLQSFAAMQIGRRRRDDYTDGTIRIPIESAPQ